MFQQLVVSTALDYLAVLQRQDHVGSPDGGQPVRNHESRPASYHVDQRLLKPVLRLHVHAGGGIVEDEHGRIEEDGPCDGETLAPGPPERVTPRSPTQVSYPAGRPSMKSCSWAILAAPHHLFHDHVVHTVSDVVLDTGGKDERVLHDNPDVSPERGERYVLHVVAVYGYAA